MRQVDVERLPKEPQWTIETKLVQAAEWGLRAARRILAAGNAVWAVADGAYAARPFVCPLMEQDITVVGRLRKDAALFDVPPVVKKPGRGRPCKYGVNRLSLAKRAAHPQGWTEVTCAVYGKEVVKHTKTFLATHATFGGTIRMVIIKEDHGPQYYTAQTSTRPCVRSSKHSPTGRPLNRYSTIFKKSGARANNRFATCGPTSAAGTSTCGCSL